MRRQVIIVTHNPNLAVYCDADQVICCTLDKENRHRIDYESGAIEDYPPMTCAVCVECFFDVTYEKCIYGGPFKRYRDRKEAIPIEKNEPEPTE